MSMLYRVMTDDDWDAGKQPDLELVSPNPALIGGMLADPQATAIVEAVMSPCSQGDVRLAEWWDDWAKACIGDINYLPLGNVLKRVAAALKGDTNG